MRLDKRHNPDESQPRTLDALAVKMRQMYLCALPKHLYIGEAWRPVYAQIMDELAEQCVVGKLMGVAKGVRYHHLFDIPIFSAFYDWTSKIERHVHALYDKWDGEVMDSMAVSVEEETDANAPNYLIRTTPEGPAITVILKRPNRLRLTLLVKPKRRFRITTNGVITFLVSGPYTLKARVCAVFEYESAEKPTPDDYRELRNEKLMEEGQKILDEHMNGATFSCSIVGEDTVEDVTDRYTVTLEANK